MSLPPRPVKLELHMCYRGAKHTAVIARNTSDATLPPFFRRNRGNQS
jgi:hypothetical protein